jgi:hypothetical protein
MSAVRTLAAIAVALVVAPIATAAKQPPPIRYDGFHFVRVTPLPKTHPVSCSLHSPTDTKLGKASRKILPAACEQPPRVKLAGVNGINLIFGR